MIRKLVYHLTIVFIFTTSFCSCRCSQESVLRVASFLPEHGDGYNSYFLSYRKGIEHFYNTNKDSFPYKIEYANEDSDHLDESFLVNNNYDVVLGHLKALEVPATFFAKRPVITSLITPFNTDANEEPHLFVFGDSFTKLGQSLAQTVKEDYKNILVIHSFDNYYDPLANAFLDNIDGNKVTLIKLDQEPHYTGLVSLLSEKNYDAYVLLTNPNEFHTFVYALTISKNKVPVFTLSYNDKYQRINPFYNRDNFPIYYQALNDKSVDAQDLLARVKEEEWFNALNDKDQVIIENNFPFFIEGYLAFYLLDKAVHYNNSFNKDYEALHHHLKLCFSERVFENSLTQE